MKFPALASPGTTDRLPQRFPLGLTLAALVAALAAGAASAKLLEEWNAAVAWTTAAALLIGLYWVVRWALSSPDPVRMGTVTCWGGFNITFLLVLVGESISLRAPDSAMASALRAGAGLVAFATAALCPVAVVVAGLRREAEATEPLLTARSAPFFVHVVSGAITTALVVGTTLLAALVVPASWPRGIVVAAVASVTAFGIAPGVWGTVYLRLLRRWRAHVYPQTLVPALDDLRALIRFEFDEIVCLDPAFGNGNYGAVVRRWRRHVLVVSTSLADKLTRDQLVAVLAHEAGHVILDHARRRIAISFVLASAGVGSVALGATMSATWFHTPVPFVPMLVAFLSLSIARALYEALVTRRHEAEADDFSAKLTSPEALLTALTALGASESPMATHNRWTTHGTWEIRSARLLRMCERQQTHSPE